MMFGNLIESNSQKNDYARKGSFFFGTLAVYALAFLAIGVGSIYAYNTHLDNLDLRVISMLPPVEAPETQPPLKTTATPKSSAGGNNSNELVVRTKPVIATLDPTRVQDKTVVSSHALELPPGTPFKIGDHDSGGNIFNDGNGTPGVGGPGEGGPGGISREMDKLVKETPPPTMKVEKSKEQPAAQRVKSMGAVNGFATYLPKPAYTALAKAAHASGTVIVQVLIDENGKVISAHAVSGPPLLLRESVQAALQARFTPTLLSNQPIKVSGIITYNFLLS